MKLLQLGPHVPCTVVRRANRFVVEVKVGGTVARAHVNNTGRLLEYLVEGRKGFCAPHRGKTSYRLFAVEDRGGAALIDTALQMKSFERAVELGLLDWARCDIVARAPRVGSSRLDYLLSCGKAETYVELKSAVLREGDFAMYPDCPTLRGRRHIMELTRLASSGLKAMIVFVAALPGVKAFKPYAAGDPEVARLLREAVEKGVEVRAFSVHYSPEDYAVHLDKSELEVVV